MTRSILALDVSASATGWAFGAAGEVPQSGVAIFATKGGTEDETWVSALKWTNQQLAILNPDIVAIEAAIMSSAPGRGGFTNPQTQMVLIGLQAVMRAVVKARMPGRARLVNVSSARKLFTGKGNYPKGEAKPAVQRRCRDLGWLDDFSIDPDRADALCVWAYVAAQESTDFALQLQFTKAPARRRKPALPDMEAF